MSDSSYTTVRPTLIDTRACWLYCRFSGYFNLDTGVTMGRRYRYQGWNEGQEFFGIGRKAGPHSGRPAEHPRLGRQARRRIEVYRCPTCREVCESPQDLRDHLADCAPVAETAPV